MTVSVLTIAGSDPSGGAGIQADLRIFKALGIAGWSAITALTVQNSQGVQAVHPVAPDVLAAQVEAALSDATDLRAVKIGMLGGAAQVRIVAQMLRRFRPPSVVLDPVLASTGGTPLLDAEGRELLVSELLPLCDLVTPNLNELSLLARAPAHDEKEQRKAGEELLERGARAVLIKGGHRLGPPDDLLLLRERLYRNFVEQRVETPHTHGTGCFLSSAIAAHLARGLDLEEAIGAAKRLLTRALHLPVVGGRGRGYPDATAAARALEAGDARAHAERLARLRGLYVLTDPDLRPDRSHEEIVRAALAGGATVVQLRDKHLPTPRLIELARRLNAMAHEADALFIVNDRVDVALASDADGVHLGPDDMHPADARRLLGPDRLLGVSVSTAEEAAPLAPFASYLGVGAIFGSATKGDAGPAVGVERIVEIKRAFPDHPLVAIGGIYQDNVVAVARAGADAAAVVSAVACAADMQEAVEDLQRHFFCGTAAPSHSSGG